MSSCEVRLLGRVQLTASGTVIPLPTRKAEFLFAYLILHAGRPIQRGRIAGSLWPDADEHRARRNLSTALWRLRSAVKLVQGIAIVTAPDTLMLHLTGGEVDVVRLRDLITRAERSNGSEKVRALQEAEAIYLGDLLEDCTDEWCEEERTYLRSLYIRLLRLLIEAYRSSADYQHAIEVAQQVLSQEPFDEDAHRELMLLYHLDGNRSAALAQYESMKTVFHKELGLMPSRPTTELWEYIRSQGISILPHVPRVSRGDDSSLFSEFSQVPIVGRELLQATLQQSLESVVRRHGEAVIISGEAGIGKTRLIEAVVAEARLRGFEVLQGNCPDLQDPAPYTAAIQALWPRVSMIQRLPEGMRSVLTRVFDVLLKGPHDGHFTISEQSSTPIDNAMIIEMLLSLVELPPNNSPTILVLEDIHRIDDATLELLTNLLGRLSRLRILVIVTVRVGERRAEQVISTLAANGAREMQVLPLSEDDTAQLVNKALDSRTVSRSIALYVWKLTNGVPLVELELLRFLLSQGHLHRDRSGYWSLRDSARDLRLMDVPSRAHEVIRRRIEHLDRRSRATLCQAAVLGAEVDYDQLREFTELRENEFLECIDGLVGAHLLLETKTGFRFPHESVRFAALSTLGNNRSRALHLKAATLLERTSPGSTEDLSWHYEEAGNLERAILNGEASGDKAHLVFANSDAVKWYTRAITLLASQDRGNVSGLRRRFGLLLKRQEVLDLVGDRRRQSADVDMIHSIAEKLGERPLVAQALYVRAKLLARMNADQESIELSTRAAHLFKDAGDIRGEARARETVGLACMNLRDQDRAVAAFRRALILFKSLRDTAGEGRTLSLLATLASYEGRNNEALKHLDHAEEVSRRSGDQRTIAHALLQRGVLYRYLGQSRRSETLLQSGIEIMKKIGDRVGEARGLSQLAVTHMVLGRLRDALHETVRGLSLARRARDIRAQMMLLNNGAFSVYRPIGNLGRAEQCITEALELVAQAKHAENTTMYQDTMAAVLLERGDLSEAVRWAERSQASYQVWPSRLRFVGADISYHLGLAYLESRRYAHVRTHLKWAADVWRKRGEISLLVHAEAALARFFLTQSQIPEAVRHARRAGRLLRAIDGTEQIQSIYWAQFQVFKLAGSSAAARRALRLAYMAVMQQASSLKGRMRRKFLTEVRVNREIIEEVAKTQRFRYRDVGAAASSLRRVSERSLSGDELNQSQISAGPAASNGRQDIEARRRSVLAMIQDKRISQRDLAESLRVSIRTIRNDLSALRKKGLLANWTTRSHSAS